MKHLLSTAAITLNPKSKPLSTALCSAPTKASKTKPLRGTYVCVVTAQEGSILLGKGLRHTSHFGTACPTLANLSNEKILRCLGQYCLLI